MGSIAPNPQRTGTHKVVCLDSYLCPVPKFDFPHEYVEYENAVGEDLIIERAKDATNVITTRAPTSAHTISLCPRLELISLMAAGKRMEAIGRGLEMKVLIAERKHTAGTLLRPGRTAFETVLKTATVLMQGCPLDAESQDMITETELRQMRRGATIINVARGGVLSAFALVKALNGGWIASAATDVFAQEPATAISTPLISKHPPNLAVSPHVAWYADATLEKPQQMVTG
ncbi:D-isomer specific 2-hydroxyacid dehydrogenase [Aspergillus filifer]